MNAWLRRFALLGLWMFSLASAEAHGGNYIINETRGKYLVAVSLSPAPMSVGRGDTQIAVRDSTNNYAPLPVQNVVVILRDAKGAATEYPAAAEGQIEDAIYGSHTLDFAAEGEWQVAVRFTDGAATEEFMAKVAVSSPAWRWLNTALYFAPLLVLVALIGLASIRNRRLRQAPLVETNTHAN